MATMAVTAITGKTSIKASSIWLAKVAGSSVGVSSVRRSKVKLLFSMPDRRETKTPPVMSRVKTAAIITAAAGSSAERAT